MLSIALEGVLITFINDTPAVKSYSISADFKLSGSVSNVVCCLNPKPQSGNKCVQCRGVQQKKTQTV